MEFRGCAMHGNARLSVPDRPVVSLHPGASFAPKGHGLSCCLSFRLFPMLAQFSVEFFPPFLGEKDSRALEFDPPLRARNRLSEPVRPFHVEVNIICSPYDQS